MLFASRLPSRDASHINYALGKLLLLLASRRISTKEAAAYGYLFQLMLQTVPGVNIEVYKTQINPAGNADLREILHKTSSLVENQAACGRVATGR